MKLPTIAEYIPSRGVIPWDFICIFIMLYEDLFDFIYIQHEGRGTGIPTIQDELLKNGSPRASIETDDERSFFLIDIPVHEGCGDIVVLSDDMTGRQNNDGVSDGVSDEVVKLYDSVSDKVNERFMTVLAFCRTSHSRAEILEKLNLKSHTDNFNRYIKPLIDDGYLQPTDTESLTSPQQRYITTDKGRSIF